MSTDQDWLAEQFESNRAYLREVGYRLLGSRADAEDAVQEAWLRLSRSDTGAIDNLAAWLTTVVSRICLDRLRERTTRPEQLVGVELPELVLTSAGEERGEQPATGRRAVDPAEEAVLADAVGLALVVVLDALSPTERVALVLHDMFGVPFDRVAHLLDTSPAAARQLASRGRRRVRAVEPSRAAPAPRAQRAVVDAFFAAAHDGDFDALLGLLHPHAVLRADGGDARSSASAIVRGRDAVARRAAMFDRPGATLLPVLANGRPAVVVVEGGAAVSVMVFTVALSTATDPRIRQVDILLDPDRLTRLDPTAVVPSIESFPASDAGPIRI
ncbi:sigma-70 family RNA polymerase sigma factor [Flexivirga oryzae]|uniref:RNA polymerase sigma-70 factor (ECF subfamily) n=1 Tax=Flexivirga oryzae TaxID=1794944 RepID=A0A839N744_9MICO|nr:sigma-70 family RNA polymerase sigma factor [Flexivirga oryzae]MBB2890512.1 RNA polymerase sigma-70 factor (ECF subfamily) [Flexivirga oryzae]